MTKEINPFDSLKLLKKSKYYDKNIEKETKNDSIENNHKDITKKEDEEDEIYEKHLVRNEMKKETISFIPKQKELETFLKNCIGLNLEIIINEIEYLIQNEEQTIIIRSLFYLKFLIENKNEMKNICLKNNTKSILNSIEIKSDIIKELKLSIEELLMN